MADTLITTGLVSEYRFDDGSGQVLNDYGPGNFDGQLGQTTGAEASDPTWTAAGLSFDGGDWIEADAGTKLAGLSQWTVSFVCSGASQSGAAIYAERAIGADADPFLIIGSSAVAGQMDRLRVWLRDPGTVTIFMVQSLRPFLTSTPHFCTVKRDGTSLTITIDGVEEGITIASGVQASLIKRTIGASQTNAPSQANFFSGTISWLATYTSALTSAEIQQNRRYALALLAPRPVAPPAWAELTSLGEGAWSWYHNERAVVQDGKVFWTYAIDGNGNTGVRSYDAANRVMGEFLLRAMGAGDDHNLAGMTFDSADRMQVGYSTHAGTPQYLRRAAAANSILAWGAETVRSGTAGTPPRTEAYTYQSPAWLPNEGTGSGRVRMFYRGEVNASGQAIKYIDSDDLGATWTADASAVTVFQNGDSKPYRLLVQNGPNRVDFIVSEDHPDQDVTNSLYHFYYDSGNYYKSDGTLISTGTASLPLALANLTLVYDGAAAKAWHWDVDIDSSGRPFVLYNRYVTPATDVMYRIARWNGTAWTHEDIAQSGGSMAAGSPARNGGAAIYDENTVFCSIKDGGGFFDLWRYTKSGGTWSGTKLTASTNATTDRHVLPCCPKGANTTYSVLWVNGPYNEFDNFVGVQMRYLAVSAATTVQSDLTIDWDIRGAVVNDITLRWNGLARVVSDSSLRWTVEQVGAVTQTVGLRWNVAAVVAADVAFKWHMLEPVEVELTLPWHVLTTVHADASLPWNCFANAGAALSLSWKLEQLVANNTLLRWNIGEVAALERITRIDVVANRAA